jgi:hypothetical protein
MTRITKSDVLALIRANRDALRALGVARVGLFGSFVRGEQRADSDVDVLVEFEPDKKSYRNFVRTSFLLQDTLQRSVELVTPESLSPYIRPNVLKEVEYVALTL